MIKSSVVVLALAAVGLVVGACSSSSSAPELDSGVKEDTGSGGNADSGSGSSIVASYSCNQESTMDGCTIFKLTAVSTQNNGESIGKAGCSGTVGTTCPSAKLIGCCTTPMELTGYGIVCSYTGDEGDEGASGDESACKDSVKGTWSTSL